MGDVTKLTFNHESHRLSSGVETHAWCGNPKEENHLLSNNVKAHQHLLPQGVEIFGTAKKPSSPQYTLSYFFIFLAIFYPIDAKHMQRRKRRFFQVFNARYPLRRSLSATTCATRGNIFDKMPSKMSRVIFRLIQPVNVLMKRPLRARAIPW